MALETFPVDLDSIFESEDAQAELLNDALASGHAGYIANALGIIARARGISGLAAETGMKRQQLYRALSEDGNPTLETLIRVVTALGYRLSAQRVGRGGLLNSVFNPMHPEKRLFHDDNLSGAAARSGSDAAYAASAAARCVRTKRQRVSSDPSATNR